MMGVLSVTGIVLFVAFIALLEDFADCGINDCYRPAKMASRLAPESASGKAKYIASLNEAVPCTIRIHKICPSAVVLEDAEKYRISFEDDFITSEDRCIFLMRTLVKMYCLERMGKFRGIENSANERGGI